MNELLLELKNIGKVYKNDKKENHCIEDINFCLRKGEIVSLLGPSGCGKSTIIKLIGGIINPDRGKINFYNKDFRIGYIPQSPSLMPNRTVYENVSLVLEVYKEVDKTRINNTLEKVGMSSFRSLFPHQLSGGMQQKVSLARALVLEPDILLMDEPFSSIDEITRWKFNFDLINLLKKNHLSVLFVTHNIEEAVLLSDRILVMSNLKPSSIIKEIPIKFINLRDHHLFHSEEYLHQVLLVRKVLEKNFIL